MNKRLSSDSLLEISIFTQQVNILYSLREFRRQLNTWIADEKLYRVFRRQVQTFKSIHLMCTLDLTSENSIMMNERAFLTRFYRQALAHDATNHLRKRCTLLSNLSRQQNIEKELTVAFIVSHSTLFPNQKDNALRVDHNFR